MTGADAIGRLRMLLQEELRQLMTVQASDRVWQMPFAAALASGLPLLISAYFDRLNYGMIATLGGLVFLYMPSTPLYHRMASVMVSAFGLIACYTLGAMSHFFTPLMMPVLVFIAVLATMVCRFYGVGPPGSLFFIMAAAVGAYSPVPLAQLPMVVGLLTMGCLLACLIGFLYSVYMLRRQAPKPVPPLPEPTFEFMVFDSVVIGVFVGISLVLAQALELGRPYWVPVTCAAVIQGASLRAVWNKQLHRTLGTTVGLLVAWGVLLLPLGKWTIPLTMMALTCIIEFTIVRHYAFASAFITPLTILLAEAATLGQASPTALIEARFYDTVLGGLVGLVGGVCLHSPRFRDPLERRMRRLIPSRLAR